jgi:DNA-binding transcriptional LysR family regulator
MSTLPPVAALRALEAVVRTGSVGGAASALGRTHGAVSKHLRTLQEHAAIPLFSKKGTGLAPTAAALELAQAVRKSMDELGSAYERIIGEARSPVLHIACSATFAMRWLVPHMTRFANRHPDVRLRLSMTSAGDRHDERDADFVIFWDHTAYPPADQGRAIRVGDARFMVVARPDYPVVRETATALHAQCRIDHDFTARAWELWSHQSGLRLLAEKTASFPHTHLCIEAALAGIGVALMEQRLVAGELHNGRLVALTQPVDFPEGFAVMPHRTRPLSTDAKAFIAWLKEALSESTSARTAIPA